MKGRCTKCIMPETKPDITFDEHGVCNACRHEEAKGQVDWDERWLELEVLTGERVAGLNYDCVVPVSGGKDSTFISMVVRDRLSLRPLLVYTEPAYITDRGQVNINNLSRLGFDIFVFKPNQAILPGLLKRSFIEDGQPARAFEFPLYAVAMQMAMLHRVPYVFWGESGSEYGNFPVEGEEGGSAADQKHNPALAGADADYWASDDVSINQLIAFQHPTAEQLRQVGVTSIYMSHYVRWDSRETAKFAIEWGLSIRPDYEVWESGGYWPFEQLDDEIPVISHLLKYLKFGYGRATDQACRDIRWGYITRETGLQLARIHDGKISPAYIERYCDYIGISMREFWGYANHFRPTDIWEFDAGEWKLTIDD